MIKSMRSERRKAFDLASAIISAILISVACTSTDATGPEIEPQGPPWAVTDSTWMVIENLRYAYITTDLELYMSCFRDDFEFWLLWENPWGLSTQQDTCWGYEFEEQCHQNMFDYVEIIELQFWGDTEYSWSGDSTGQSLVLIRNFDLKVFTDPYGTTGYRASGSALFICRQDSTGEWYVWQWYDQSDTKENSAWGAIKMDFSWTNLDSLLL